jgi:hypothetical protein
VINIRSPVKLILKVCAPVATILMQNIVTGFVYYYMKRAEPGDWISLMNLIVSYEITMFSNSLFPLSTLSEHFDRRMIIVHEIDQGYYGKYVYLVTAMLIDILLYTLIGFMISLITIFWYNYECFMVFFINSCNVMLFTNFLLWLLSYFVFDDYTPVLLTTVLCISYSFVFNNGVLIFYKNNFTAFLQYFSIMHLQTNSFLHVIDKYLPNSHDNITNVVKYININTFVLPWLGLSFGLLSTIPIAILIIFLLE